MNLNAIEALTRKLSEARAELAEIITTLQLKQAALLTDQLPLIKRKVGITAERHANLLTGIDGNRALFTKPRTHTYHGIEVGLRKGSGGITWENADDVVARIERRFKKSQADLLIKVEKTPIKNAIAELSVDDLKAIGCSVRNTTDVVVIRPVDTEVDKVVNGLLKNAVIEAQEVAA